MSTLKERLVEERKRLGLNQTDFGKLGKVSRETQINYESGKRKPDSDYLEAIAQIGVDVQYVITGIHSQTRASGSVSLSEEDRGALETAMKILKRVLRVFIF